MTLVGTLSPVNQTKQRPSREPVHERGVFCEFGALFQQKTRANSQEPAQFRELRRFFFLSFSLFIHRKHLEFTKAPHFRKLAHRPLFGLPEQLLG